MPVPDLQRFVDAQQPIYAQVCSELRAGAKRSHWMWFIFPQLAQLGRSTTAQRYGIVDKAHAQAYLAHPLLGPRLIECVSLVNMHRDLTAGQMFGYQDYRKLHSSVTLFGKVAPQDPQFIQALKQFYRGLPDPVTLKLLQHPTPPP